MVFYILWLVCFPLVLTMVFLLSVDLPLRCPSTCFFSCPLSQSVLSWLQSLMFLSFSCCPSLTCHHVLFGFAPDELRIVPYVFVYMPNVCKYFIWHACNDFRFHDVQPGAIVVIEGVKSRVCFHLPLLFRRFKSSRHRRYFGRQWGARGIIGSVIGSRLVVHI